MTYLFVVVLGFSGAPAAHAQQIKVMQWNIRGHLGSVDSNNTVEAKAIARVVNYNRPDVLLFCELQNISVNNDSAALIAWVTNNVPYLGTVPSSILGSSPTATFWVSISSKTDGFIRNGAISRYPISDETTYNDNLRGLHRFRVQLAGTNVLEVFHTHLKCCATALADCTNRQQEAAFDADTITNWAAANSIPYIMAGDWNEDESHPECTTNSFYHPVTTLREGAHLVEFKPSALNGDTDTESTPNPTIRIDYCLAASNRLSAVSGYVFNSNVWATNTVQNGLYTNEVTGSTPCDSTKASDHCSVFVVYSFPAEPPDFTVSSTNAFASSGNEGGPFTPSSQVYTLTNTNATSLSWGATNRESWVSLSATNGTLAPGDSTNITVSINSNANTLNPRSYIDFVTFRDTATGGSLICEVDLTVNISGFFDDFSTFTDGNLVTQQAWTLYDTSNSLPLQVTGGQVVIPYAQSADNQDAYKNFSASATAATTFWGATLTISNAPSSSSPAYFLAMTPDINGSGTARYRLTAKNNGGGTYTLGARITSGVLTFGSTGLTYGTPYRVIVEGDSGWNAMKVFVNPTSTNLAAQTPYLIDNNGDCFGPTQVGSLLISQFGSGSVPNVGLSIGKAAVANNFADVYNFLTPTLTVTPTAGFDASGDQGGPFTPDTQVYTLGNSGISSLSWSASVSSNWLTVSATSGTLAGGASTNITVTVNGNASTLVGGLYSNLVSFVNVTDGIGTTNSAISLLVRDGIPDWWRLQYFGHVDPRASDQSRAQDDPDGDGYNNLCEFQAGTGPTSSASYFHITSVTVQGSSLLLTWATGLGRTNVVQATAGLPDGSYSTNFGDVSSWIILPDGSGPTTTNFPDTGAATNSPARYYRIRLQP